MTGTDILAYVEDPGAANFVAGLPRALAAGGLTCRLFAGGDARAHLAALGERFEPCAPDASARALADDVKPRLVLSGTAENRDSLGLSLIDAARARGIPSVGVVDGPSHVEARFSGRTSRADAHAPDRIVVPDAPTAAAFRAAGFAAGRLSVAGHPQFDRVRAERRRLETEGRAAVRRRVVPDAAPEARIALFLAELSDGMAPELYRHAPHWTLSGRRTSELRTQIAIEEFLDAGAGLGLRRILRLHPKNRPEEYAAYRGEFASFSAGGLAYDLVFAADLVVGMTTFLLVEAVLLGRPTLSILPDPAQAVWLPSAVAGLTPTVSRRPDILPMLKNQLGNVPDPTLTVRSFPEGATAQVAQIVASML
jgi:hypothetical protein